MKKYYGPNNKSISLSPDDLRRQYYFPDAPSHQGVAMVFPPRYNMDLFYIAPFYHSSITNIDKLIVVDLDIEFRCSIGELFSMFDEFSENEVMSISNNQSPYYYLITQGYRDLHPDSKVGSPGKFQGFNTGVVLFDFDKMRNNSIYMEETKLNKMVELHNLFLPAKDWGLGDQEWLTLLGWKLPQMIHHLPCQYNRQTTTRGLKEEKWKDYFQCDHVTKLFHTTPLW